MFRKHKNNLIILLLFVSLFLVLGFLPFSIYGQDGYHLWFPIIAEYLNGDQVYHASAVIFNGQNLAAIYGELPFWKIFRALNFSIVPFLNLTHATFCSLFFYFIYQIVKGLKKEIQIIDIVFMSIFVLLNPTITNRIMAGHLNLIFGVLPFFIAVSLIFDKSKCGLLVSTIGLWFSFSTQAYQILTYHFFYIPLLFYFVQKYESHKKSYIIALTCCFFLAFLINSPQFLDMYKHAHSSDNLRLLETSSVYSYIVSTPFDILNLFTTTIGPALQFRPFGYFHEVNYGMGCFLLLFFLVPMDKKFKLLIGITISIIFLFCMDVPIFNLLAAMPIIKAFRVPQRALMILSLIVPIWIYCHIKFERSRREVELLLCSIVLGQFIPSFEIIVLIGVVVIIFISHKEIYSSSNNFKNIVYILCITTLFSNAYSRFKPSISYQASYNEIKEKLKPIIQKYSKKELRNNTFHFSGVNPPLLNYVGQSMGIRTLEGYGHPPTSLLKHLEKLTSKPFSPTTNNFYFPNLAYRNENFANAFGINVIITMQSNGELFIEEL